METIATVKLQAKQLSAATGEPLGRCLETIARQRANMNWHAYRHRLIRPAPIVRFDKINYRLSARYTPHPDESMLINRIAKGQFRSSGPSLAIPSVLLQRMCTVAHEKPVRSTETFADVRHHIVLDTPFEEWMEETCSGAFRLSMLLVANEFQNTECQIGVLQFKKDTDGSVVKDRLIDRNITVLTGQALDHLEMEHIRLLNAISENGGVVRNAVRDGWIGGLVELGLILITDVYQPVILTEVGREVLSSLMRLGYRRQLGDVGHSADALLTRNDALRKKTIASEQIAFFLENHRSFQEAKAVAVEVYFKNYLNDLHE